MGAWLKRLYEEHEWAFYLAGTVLSLGGAGLVVNILSAFFALHWGWSASIFAFVAGVLMIGLQSLPPRRHASISQDGESAPFRSGTKWESLVTAESPKGLTLHLRAVAGPLSATRAVACEVIGPLGGPPSCAVLDHRGSGPVRDIHVHFPGQFVGPDAVVSGRYRVTWYEFDEEWNRVEILRDEAEIELPRGEEVQP
jgi:hypothetical protein